MFLNQTWSLLTVCLIIIQPNTFFPQTRPRDHDPKLGKDFLELINNILEANSKMVMKTFSHVRLFCLSMNFMVLAYLSKKSQNHGNLLAWKFFMTIYVFVGQFFFQNDVFNSKKSFQSMGSEYVFLENGHGSFQKFLFNIFKTNQWC
jgi:hypothetical protein